MKMRSPMPAFALAAALALSAAPASAGEIWVGADAGLGVPIGNLSDLASTGYHLGFHGAWYLTEQFGVGGELAWESYGGNDDLEKELSALNGEPVEVTLRMIPVLAFAEYRLPGQTSMVPSLRGGIGLYSMSTEIEGQTFSNDDGEGKFGLHIGGGLNGEISDTVRWGTDLLYHYILDGAAGDGGEDTAGSLFTVRARISFALVK